MSALHDFVGLAVDSADRFKERDGLAYRLNIVDTQDLNPLLREGTRNPRRAGRAISFFSQ